MNITTNRFGAANGPGCEQPRFREERELAFVQALRGYAIRPWLRQSTLVAGGASVVQVAYIVKAAASMHDIAMHPSRPNMAVERTCRGSASFLREHLWRHAAHLVR
jgi:hypothetical protein